MVMQPKSWMIVILFNKWIFHFIASIQNCGGNLNPTNRHLLILNGHNSHGTIDVVHKTMNVGLDLITLPSHTSHPLQPLDVSCMFQTFQNVFRAYIDVWTLAIKGMGVSKEDLA
jgi:hypothetical protein